MAIPVSEQVTITGIPELRKSLLELSRGMSKNILRASASAGAQVIKKQTTVHLKGFGFSTTGKRLPKGKSRARVPGGFPDRISGTLQRAVYKKQIREESNFDKQTYYVSARKGKRYQAGQTYGRKKQKTRKRNMDAFYAKFVEFGHKLVPRAPSYSVNAKGKKVPSVPLAVRRRGATGRVPPYPYLEPAYVKKKAEAVDAMKGVFVRRMPIEVAKARGARRIP